jgi:Uma2 family endonuclease
MAPDSREIADQSTDPEEAPSPMKDWYDRSSLLGDFLVMIADQSEQDYLRRCPENRFCERIDGVVYLHPGPLDGMYEERRQKALEAGETLDPMADWYDRSSLVGDFMVMIPDQTVEDYMRRCPENKFCEYIDGIVYMPSPVDIWHQFETQFFAVLLEMFAEERNSGIVLTGPAALKIREGRIVEPDLFVLPPGGFSQIHGTFCELPALFVIEVLSRSTRSHDLKEKAEFYREAGVLEFWFVDLRDQILIVHRRTDDGYEMERIEAGPYHLRCIPGFWINVTWLWEKPRPNLSRCLEAILAGPPA